MKHVYTILLLWLLTVAAMAQGDKARSPMRETSREFFTTAEARRVGDQLLLFQRVTGGWPKNIDMARRLTEEERAAVERDKARLDDSTIDNNATSMQLAYLARLYQGTGEKRYREAFRRGVEFLLSGQYANGGWPQFWPVTKGYHLQITYNDGAMVNTMRLLRDIAEQQEPYGGKLTTKSIRKRALAAFNNGLECILKTQIVMPDGSLGVWCQQHDRVTLQPTLGRSYELPSYCSQESTGIVTLLMELPNPDERVKRAVRSAMAWFEKYKLTGVRMVRTGKKGTPEHNTRLVEDKDAEPLWARFYSLSECEPFVCDRDGVPRQRLEDIGAERRNGYLWYSSAPRKLFRLYDKWKSTN